MEKTEKVLPKTDSLQAEQRNVMRFLIMHDFNQGSMLTIRNLALLIAKNNEGLLSHLMNEYVLMATNDERPETIRAKLVYCIKQNHAPLKNAIQTTYDYNIGNFYGIKSFIDQISLVYSVYAKAE